MKGRMLARLAVLAIMLTLTLALGIASAITASAAMPDAAPNTAPPEQRMPQGEPLDRAPSPELLPPNQLPSDPLPPDRMPPNQPQPGQQPPPPTNEPRVAWSHYRLGDSPRDADGIFEWTKPGALREWNAMPAVGTPAKGETYIWLAGMLPIAPGEGLAPDPYLMFGSVEYDFELYSGTRLLYRRGDMEGGADKLHAEEPVLVPLEGHQPDRPLMLRIHSQRSNVLQAKIGHVMYGTQADLQLRLIEQDMLDRLIVLVFFMIGFVALILYLINRDSNDMLYFALFALSMCLSRVLFSLRSPVLFIDDFSIRLFAREPLAGFTIYMFTLYFVQAVKPAYERGIRQLGRALLAGGLFIFAVKLAVPGLWEQYSGLIADIQRIGFSALCALCLAVGALALRRRASSEAIWFVAGLSCYLLVNIVGHPLRLYVEHNIGRIGWEPIEYVPRLVAFLDYSLLVYTVFLGIITFRRYAEVYRKLRSYNEQLARWNQTLESTVRERTRAIRNLLDHAGQGFLTLDERLAVQREYSEECRRLFGREIAGANFVGLMCPDRPDEQMLQAEILQSVFAGDELQREVCLSLLPTEAEVEGKRVALQYKWIPAHEANPGKVMVILTDISEQRRLEDQMARERQVLRMVVHVIRHYRDFKDMLEEYRQFARGGLEALMNRDLPWQEICAELARAVHTFKGNFAQLDFANMTRRLHEFESQLDGWKARLARSADDGPDFAVWCVTQDMPGWLEEDMRVLRDILGDQFDIDQEVVTIRLERLQQFEQQVYRLLPSPEAEAIAEELKRLQHRPFRELLAMYPDYAVRLAEMSGKEIHPVRITGGEQLVDPKVYTPFARTLIHVFRNMIDHGIESPEERVAMGKERRGTIRCEISGNEQEIRLLLSNNGEKVNLSIIRQTALARGIVTSAELETMSEDEQRMLIFRDGFTTKQTVSGVSGRGVGLAAVREAVEALGGTVQLESSTELTTFKFTIPLAAPSPG